MSRGVTSLMNGHQWL